LDTAQREWESAQKVADAAQQQDTEKQLLQRLHEEQARQQALEQDAEALQGRIDAVQPDILEQDIERYARSALREYETHAERERTLRELDGRLQALGAQGLEEQRASV